MKSYLIIALLSLAFPAQAEGLHQQITDEVHCFVLASSAGYDEATLKHFNNARKIQEELRLPEEKFIVEFAYSNGFMNGVISMLDKNDIIVYYAKRCMK